MNDTLNEFSIKLAKSLVFGFNSKISVTEINHFLNQIILTPNTFISIKLQEQRYYTQNRVYDLQFIATKAILFYNKNIDFEIRKLFLENLLSNNNPFRTDKQINIKYWIRIVFADFDNYIQYSHTWEELIYLFIGSQTNNKQIAISQLVVQQFNKNFRNINKRSRTVLLEKLVKNENLRKEVQVLILKNMELINKNIFI